MRLFAVSRRAALWSALSDWFMRGLLRIMANDLNVMSIGVKNKCAVVVRVIVGTDSGCSIVACACGKRGFVERVNDGAI